MVKNYVTLNIEEDVYDEIKKCKEEYLSHHKELDGVFISKSKILREIIKFYLKN